MDGPCEILPEEIQFDPSDIIGTGTFGTVYKGKCRGLEVAVKVLHKQDLDDNNLKKLRDVVKELSADTSSHCIFGACTVPGKLQIVSELCKSNLTMYLKRRGHMDLQSVLLLAQDIAIGVNYLQGKQFYSNHLNPANILIDFHDKVKISDFGLDMLRNRKTTWGPHIWMSPDRINKSGIKSRRVIVHGKDVNTYNKDHTGYIYSFGIIFWHMLTQELPYQYLDNWQAFTDAVCHKHEHPPFKAQYKIPKPVQTFIESCLDLKCKFNISFVVHKLISDMVSNELWTSKFTSSPLISHLFTSLFSSKIEPPPDEVEWTIFQKMLVKEVGVPAQQLGVLHSLLARRKLVAGREVYVVSKEWFSWIVYWFGPFYTSTGSGKEILEQMIFLQHQRWFYGCISKDEAKAHYESNNANFVVHVDMNSEGFGYDLLRVGNSTMGPEIGRVFNVNRLKERIVAQKTTNAEIASSWVRICCQGLELRKQVSWTEFQDRLAHELQVHEEQLERFCPLFVEQKVVGEVQVQCVTLYHFSLLADRYGLFCNQVGGKELLEQALLHDQLWFYNSITDDEADTHLSNFSNKTFLVHLFLDMTERFIWGIPSYMEDPYTFVVSSPNDHEKLVSNKRILKDHNGAVYRSMADYVASFPIGRLTYVSRTTGRLEQLPINCAWAKYIKKSESWMNHKQLGHFTGVHELGLHVMQANLIAEAELITILAEITNLANVVSDYKFSQKPYKCLQSTWLCASLHQVVNECCVVLNFKTTLDTSLEKILSQETRVVNEILSNNVYLRGLCSEIAQEVKQAVELVANTERKFDDIVKLIQELHDAMHAEVLHEKDHTIVSKVITASLMAAVKVKQQWITLLEILKGNDEVLLAQHSTTESTQELAFLLNKSNAQIFIIGVCRRLSYDHLYLSLPLLDEMLGIATSDTSTHTKMESELKEKLDYYLLEVETLFKNIKHEVRETFGMEKN